MPTERTSAGDPARTLALLWRDPTAAPSRGPKRGLDIGAVVAAATDLADREGLEAVTMRRLAKQLGTAAMTLYTYLPGKAELVDLMLDAAYSRLPLAEYHHSPVAPAAYGGRGREPRPVSGAPVGGRGLHLAASTWPGADGQV